MKVPEPRPGMPDDVAVVWREVVASLGVAASELVGPQLEAYCGQVARLRDAQKRLATDGAVVADPKGSPIPHPALEIERKAQVEVRAWGARFTARPVPREETQSSGW